MFTSSRNALYTRFSLNDWNAANVSNYMTSDKARSGWSMRSDKARSGSEKVRLDAARLCREANDKTTRTQNDVGRRLGDRIGDIEYWKTEILSETDQMITEIDALNRAKAALEKMLADLETPLHIAQECLETPLHIAEECLETPLHIAQECLETPLHIAQECLETPLHIAEECLETPLHIAQECLETPLQIAQECLETPLHIAEECLETPLHIAQECLETPLHIAQECLYNREKRQGIDLVHDDVERALLKASQRSLHLYSVKINFTTFINACL